MKLRELAKNEFANIDSSRYTKMIGIYEQGKQIEPDYADEYLETHGDEEVCDSQMVFKDWYAILVVDLKKGEDDQ